MMKNHKDTFNTLLETLSQEGDSAAFFSRCEPFFRERYQKERNNGISHEDASKRIQTEASELFCTFVTIAKKQQSTWLEEHCSAHHANDSDSDEVLLDKKIVAETASFLHDCSQLLIRTAFHYRREHATQKKQFLYRIQHSPFFPPIGIALIVLLVCASILFIMVKTETSLSLTLDSNGVKNTLIIPFIAPDQAAETTPQQQPPSKITDSLAAADTIKKTADSLPAVTEQKNVTPTQPVRKPLPSAALPPAERRPVAPVVRQAPPYTPPPAPVSAPPPQPVVRPEPPAVPPEPADLPEATESSTPESGYPSEPASY